MNKGSDKANVIFGHVRKIQEPSTNDEIKNIDEIKEYLDCIYICEQDVMWRLLGFEMHYHWPPVERLPVHLPLMNIIKMKANTKLTDITRNPKNTKTMLTEWLNINKEYKEARELTYCEFPEKWLWDEKNKTWKKKTTRFQNWKTILC